MYEPGDIFAEAAMTRAELAALDADLFAVQGKIRRTQADWQTPGHPVAGVYDDVVQLRRDVNAVFPWGA
jgi:hypothetical protein